MVGRRQKISKLHWLKRPKTIPKIRKPTKNGRKDHSFCNTVSLKKPHSLILRNSTHSTLQKVCSRNSAENPLTLHFFQQTRAWLVLKKNLHCTNFRRPRTAFLKHCENKCLYIPVHLRKKLLSGGELNNFLKVAHCLDPVICFKTFHFN